MDMDNCKISTEKTPSISQFVDNENPIANQSITVEKTAETIDSPMNFEKKPLKKDSGLKSITPVHRLQLPKASNFSERCMSPTDLLISPVSRRLLSRNRKGSGLAAPPKSISKEAVPIGI